MKARVNRIVVALLALSCVCFPAVLADAAELAKARAYTVKPDNPEAVVDAAFERAEAAIDRIVAVPDDQRTFRNTIWALDDIAAQLELDTNMIQFMAYVSPDRAQRAIGEATEKRFNEFMIDLGKNTALYNAIKTYADTKPDLTGEKARLLKFTLRDYRRAGMNLTQEKRDELKSIQKQISDLSIEFEKNIREDDTRVPLTREELAGMSDEFVDGLLQSDGIYLVGMSYPEFFPIMRQCDIPTTRQKVWIAYKRRGGQKNVRVLEDLLVKRAEAADLLEYKNPAEYEIEVRMAKTPKNVLDFYKKLRPLVRKKARRDYDEFVTAKREHTGNPDADLKPWDYWYYETKLLKDKYAVDSEKVQEYFPLESVMDGLFHITQKLYGIEYRDVTHEATARGRRLWHEDVKLYEVLDTRTGEMLGEFYLDLHPRKDKYGHAAQWGLAQHKVFADGSTCKPLAALVCNFTKPTETKPSLLTHDEVETFFHEFGHCLHTILSEGTFQEFSGTGVERDFVEAPSQMFENWVWNAKTLGLFARHYKTGEPLPEKLLERMVAAKNLGSGMKAERQFFYGLYDMKCHLDPEGDVDTTELAHHLWDPDGENVELYDPVPNTYFHAAFGHLTGYQAGYYGYQWSLVYACDMFQRFKQDGMLSEQAGRRFRDRILAQGGTKDGLELVKDFLGREPDMTAYLKHLGLNVDE